MRLSHAILLGDSLKKCDPLEFISADGRCGCAFGGALLAAGVNSAVCNTQIEQALRKGLAYQGIVETVAVKTLWPWMDGEVLRKISRMYIDVAAGRKTIEQLCDYVRSIEPSEPDEFSQMVDVLKEEKVEVL